MSEELKPVAFPPLPKGYVTLDGLTRYDAMQVHQYALRYADAVVAAQSRQAAQPVATITECEACFTPDVCRLRGKCDHYSAEQVRVAAQPQQAEPACPRCLGSGETTVLSGGGPDAYDVAINCDACGGTGAVPPQQTAKQQFDAFGGPTNQTLLPGCASSARWR